MLSKTATVFGRGAVTAFRQAGEIAGVARDSLYSVAVATNTTLDRGVSSVTGSFETLSLRAQVSDSGNVWQGVWCGIRSFTPWECQEPEPEVVDEDGQFTILPAPQEVVETPVTPATQEVVRSTTVVVSTSTPSVEQVINNVTNRYYLQPTIRETVEETKYVTREFSSGQSSRILDSVDDSVGSLSTSLSEEVTTDALVVSGDSSILGSLSLGTTTYSANDALTLDGVIYMASVTAPSVTTNRLYNDGGTLYWAGTAFAGSSIGNWSTDGTNLYRTGGNVGIGTSTPTQKLTVAGSSYITGGLGIGVATTTSGVLETSGNARIGGDLVVVGDSTVFGDSTTIGTSTSSTLVVNSRIDSDLVPEVNNMYNLGSAARYWGTAYIDTLNANSISAASSSISGTQAALFTLNSDNATADTEDIDLVFYRGTVVPNALISWDSTADRFDINQPFYIQNDSSTTTVTTLAVQGSTGQTASIFDVLSIGGNSYLTVSAAGNIGISSSSPSSKLTVEGNTYLGGSLTATGTVQFSSITDGFLVADSAGNVSASSSLSIAYIADAYLLNTGDTATGDYNFDSGTLFVDSVNNRVGVGDATPSYDLDIGIASAGLNVGASGTGAPSIYLRGIEMMTYYAGALQLPERLLLGSTSNYPDTSYTAAMNLSSSLNGLVARGPSSGTASFLQVREYSGGAPTFNVESDGSAYFVGNVGIGTTSPTNKFEVWGSNATAAFYAGTTGSPIVAIGQEGTRRGYWRWQNAGQMDLVSEYGDLTFWTGVSGSESQKMTIDTSGNVGIGTTSPSALLHISSTAAKNLFQVDDNGPGDSSPFVIDQNGDVTASRNIYTNTSGTGGYGLYVGPTGFQGAFTYLATGDAQISPRSGKDITFADSPGGTELVRIRSNGRVGIGELVPGSKLSVSGNATIGSTYDTLSAPTNGLLVEGNIGIGTTSPASKLDVWGDLRIGTSSTPTLFTDVSADRVGIGTANPSHKLSINGGASFAGSILLNEGSWFTDNIIYVGSESAGPVNASMGFFVAGVGSEDASDGSYFLARGNSFSAGANQRGNMYFVAGNPSSPGASEGSLNFLTGADQARMIIDNSGNVGIGSTTPSYGLTLVDNAAGSVPFAIQNTSNTGWSSIRYLDDTGSTAASVGYGNSGTSVFSNRAYMVTYDNTTPIVMATDATERLRIDGSGNIGIGTTSPDVALDVVGDVDITSAFPTLSFMETGVTDNNFRFQINGGKLSLQEVNDAKSVATDRLVIDTSGNVGIGTTSPASRLHVYNGVSGATAPSFANDVIFENGAAAGLSILSPDGSNGHLNFSTPSNTTVSAIASSYNSGSEYLQFYVGGSASGNVAMHINDSGNVGIGTTSPQENLHIAGPSASIILQRTDNPVALSSISFRGNDNVVDWAISTNYYVGGGLEFVGGASGTTFMYIKTTGQVGIGETNPADKLDVNGDIRVGTGTTGCVKDSDGTTIAGTCSSDIRLKTDIDPLSTSSTSTSYLEAMMALEPVNYRWNNTAAARFSYGTEELQTGLIAQQVQANMPELVVEGEDGFLQVRFSEIPIYLLQAMKELYAQVQDVSQYFSDGALSIMSAKIDYVRSDTIEANKLCVGEVCVTEEEFAEVFGSGAAEAASAGDNSSDSSTSDGGSTSGGSTSDNSGSTDAGTDGGTTGITTATSTDTGADTATSSPDVVDTTDSTDGDSATSTSPTDSVGDTGTGSTSGTDNTSGEDTTAADTTDSSSDTNQTDSTDTDTADSGSVDTTDSDTTTDSGSTDSNTTDSSTAADTGSNTVSDTSTDIPAA